MYAIVVWNDKDTLVPNVFGPYLTPVAFEDAEEMRKTNFKVQVCNSMTPQQLNQFRVLTIKES